VKSPGPRRVPKQARSRDRYDAILNAATNLFSEKGFERTTTNEIASRAEVSIGSLYQYFQNKEDVVRAIMDRHIETVRGVTDDFMSRDVQDLPVPEAVDQLLEPYIRFHTESAAFSRLWLGADLSEDLDETLAPLSDQALRRVETLVRARMPGLSRGRVRVISVVTQSAVKSMLSMLMREGSARFRSQAASEVKRMLVDYFESLIREHKSGPDSAPRARS
jgi:AcrR family transcriptional regulator